MEINRELVMLAMPSDMKRYPNLIHFKTFPGVEFV